MSSRTQSERTAASRRALLDAARELFGTEGFAPVGTEQIANRAGMSRGALYHQFDDKIELFAAVLDEIEAEIEQQMLAAVAAAESTDTATLLLVGARAFLDACTDPATQRIVLLDGPSVLGWERWREICLAHSVGLVKALLADGIERGVIIAAPVEALTHMLVGAVDEAALYVVRADNPDQARTEVDLVLQHLAHSLVRQPR